MTSNRSRKPGPTAIATILASPQSGLRGLVEHAQLINKLNTRLKGFLSEPLSSHLVVARLQQDTLLILTDSPAWSARLRYRVPEILDFLKEKSGLPHLKSIRIKVSKPPKSAPVPAYAGTELSRATSNLLLQVAESMPDPSLKSTLSRLSSRKPAKKP